MSQVDEPNKATLLKVYFDLPFVLFVKDSLRDTALEAWAEAYAKGVKPLPYAKYAPAGERPGFMTIGGGFPVYLPPPELAPYYEVRVSSLTVGIRTLRRVNPHRATVMMGEIPGDRTGRASFSSVLVLIDPDDLTRDQFQNPQFIAQLAVDATNHLIGHYRILADRPFIRSVTVSEVQEFVFYTTHADGTETQMEFGSGSGPLHGFWGAIEDSIDAALREAVSQETPPSIVATLDADIRDHLDLREWRLALIQTAVVFEALLSEFIRKWFGDQGLSEEAINQKFFRKAGLPHSATYLARVVVKEATGNDFAQTKEFEHWASNVRDPRNDIVHGKRFLVAAQDAYAAYNATAAAIALLRSY